MMIIFGSLIILTMALCSSLMIINHLEKKLMISLWAGRRVKLLNFKGYHPHGIPFFIVVWVWGHPTTHKNPKSPHYLTTKQTHPLYTLFFIGTKSISNIGFLKI
jgi:hypothetical protein